MHSSDQRKDAKAFRDEIDAILLRTSAFHRPQDHFDFRYFIFHETNFKGVTFTEKAFFGDASFIQEADFSGATFTQCVDFVRSQFTRQATFKDAIFMQNADFSVAIFTQVTDFLGSTFKKQADFTTARFTQGANFYGATFTEWANFVGATFPQKVTFWGATFTQGANFRGATFTEAADFTSTLWGAGKDNPVGETVVEPAIADFRDAKFIKPEQVRFLQVNAKGRQGFRGRFVNCLIKGVLFEDVDWHKENGRMVLQDERDRLANAEGAASYEQVAAAYRRFIINFDEAKQYDLSEDCMIGAMEMKRLDPAQFLFAKRFYKQYEKYRWVRQWDAKWPWLRRPGEHLSVTNLYRLASNYGSSYRRAFWVLSALLIAFGLLFTFAVELTANSESTKAIIEPIGVIHAIEVVTFQSEPRHMSGSGLGWFLEIAERLLIAGQLALFLLALRRRFRR